MSANQSETSTSVDENDDDDGFSCSYMILYRNVFLCWSYELNQSLSIIEQACSGKE